MEAMAGALESIIENLDGNQKPLAVKLRGIALAGLGRQLEESRQES